MITRGAAAIEVSGQPLTLHYAVAGRGAPLLMLHPSPLSSAFLAPAMAQLAQQCLTIAPDTPGYGDSDSFAAQPQDMTPYCDALAALLDALELPQAAVYGSATGAQIAIEFAKAYPQRVSGVILDNAADFTDADRARIMDGYFPDITPQADGSHLARAWQVGHDLLQFFPWHLPSSAHRIAPAPASAIETGPIAAMEATALGYLAAGPSYDHAYRVAFANERAERVQAIQQPTVIVRWAGSILKPYTDRFDAVSFGDNVTMAPCAADPAARWACVAAQLPGVLPGQHAQAEDLPRAADLNGPEALPFRYIGAAGAQLRLVPLGHPATDGSAPLIAPPIGLSARTFAAWLPRAGDAPADAWVLDLPGHGGSDPAADTGAEAMASALTERLASAALLGTGTELRLYGTASALTPALRGHPLVVSLRACSWLVEGRDRAPQWPPEVVPSAGGGHLFELWHWLRRLWLMQDSAPPAPHWLTSALVDLLRTHALWTALKEEFGP